jgi:hypothetical protein
MLTLYRCLLSLYPAAYRCEFAEEMTSVFCDAQRALPMGCGSRFAFCVRELSGLLYGVFREHLRALDGANVLCRRFDMQPQFRFARSTVALMTAIFGGVVFTIAKATRVQLAYGDTLGSVWPSLLSTLAFIVLSTCVLAGMAWVVLHAFRRAGVDRLANLQTWPDKR